MPIGNASIKRATGAISKTGEKAQKNAFRAETALSEIEISKIKFTAPESVPAELIKSVKKYGVLHPVFVLCDGEAFTLISGKLRLRAAIEAGLTAVKAIVLTLEGSGAQTAKKEVLARYRQAEAAAEIAVTADSDGQVSDIHEEKFNAIRSIGKDLPDYLL